MIDFDLDAETRSSFVDEMLGMADGKNKAIRGQRAAIEALVAWHEGGKQGEEPYAEDVDGVTWKMACAISSDLARIFHQALPEGTYANQYGREYVTLRRQAIRVARNRQQNRSKSGMDQLRSMLTL